MKHLKVPKNKRTQFNLLGDTLNEFINPKHELNLLSNSLDLLYFEKEFSPLC